MLLGIFIFFSDYFSPLYVGTVIRNITDKARVSREKLAYICDSTSAPVCTLIPFSSWGVYMAGLLVATGAFTDKNIAMKAAEKRAMETGKIMSYTAKPLLGKEISDINPNEGIKSNLFLNFFAPAIIIITVTLGTYGSAKTLEGFMLAVAYQFVVMIIQKMGTVAELMEAAVSGIKGIMAAVLILSLAYALNSISKELGTAQFVISMTQEWLTLTLLLVFTFLICAFVAFLVREQLGLEQQDLEIRL